MLLMRKCDGRMDRQRKDIPIAPAGANNDQAQTLCSHSTTTDIGPALVFHILTRTCICVTVSQKYYNTNGVNDVLHYMNS